MIQQTSVRIPATSANLGPGFDCMGLALDLWNTFSIGPAKGSLTHVETRGEGAGKLPTDHSNLIAQVVAEEYRKISGKAIAPFELVCENTVPPGSGLGSSSTAVLGGLLLAHAQFSDDVARLIHPKGPVLKRAIELEGHGDNVAPALLGGLIVVSANGNDFITRRIDLPPTRVIVCVPDFHFLTSTARAVVPTQLSRADAIFNIGRALLVTEALRAGNLDLLAQSQADRIHEPYRLPVIPGAAEARRAALDHGAASVCLSGAGPGLIAFAESQHDEIGRAMAQAFANAELAARFWSLEVIAMGAQIKIGPSELNR